MKMHDFDPQQEKVILLIHPTLASAELLEEILGQHLRPGYRRLVPDLSGHGEAAGDPFVSAAAEAEGIRRYLKKAGITRLHMAFGASLGAAVLMELLRAPGLTVDYLFFEGASFYEHEFLLGKGMKMAALKQRRAAEADPGRAVQAMARLYGTEAARPMARQLLAISDASIQNAVHAVTHVHLPKLTPAQQKHCVFSYGEKDPALKQARRLRPSRFPHAAMKIWAGLNHCEKITADSAGFAHLLNTCL